MKYCEGCHYYIPTARYQYEMKDAKMRKCKHYSICNRIRKLAEKNQLQQMSFINK